MKLAAFISPRRWSKFAQSGRAAARSLGSSTDSKVGPESAGARPGPACYGLGGTRATVTDADVVLGIIDPNTFLGGKMKLDRDAAARVIDDQIARPLNLSTEEAAAGIRQIVDAQMADT